MTQPTPTSRLRIGPVDLVARAGEALQLQRDALASSTGMAVSDDRGAIFAAHTARPAYRALAATDEAGSMAGFAYGYAEPPGSWWDSYVRPRMTERGLAELMDQAWTVVELMVSPHAQGTGLGRRLITALVDGLPYPRVQLSTQRDGNPARAFYDRLGFGLLTEVDFPNLPTYVVLGRALPLT